MSSGGNPNLNMPRNAAGNSNKSSSNDPTNLISIPSNPAAISNSNSSNNNNNRSNHHHQNNNNNRNNNHNRQSGNGNGSGRRGAENLNHLLGFQLAPRARPPAASGPRRGTNRKAASVPFNKERYVNAQYRFLVKPTGDYTALFADADIFLNWSDILQVIIPTSTALSSATSSSSSSTSTSRHSLDHEGSTCPICLSKPVSPRMTKCGHVFCYPCILHYLSYDTGGANNFMARIAAVANQSRLSTPGASPSNSRPITHPTYDEPTRNLSGRAWKRCPICWDSVYVKDLKAVRWFDPNHVAKEHEHEEEIGDEGQGDEDVVGKLEGVENKDQPSNPTSLPSNLSDLIGPLLSMRLIERPILTTLALPKSSTWPPPPSAFSPSNPNLINSSNQDYPVIIPPHSAPWHFQPDVLPFAKFMLATPELLLDSLSQDLDALEEEKVSLNQMAEMTKKMGGVVDDVSIQYAQMAEDKVREQMAKVSLELDVESVRSSIGRARNDLKEFKEILKNNKNGIDERRRNVSRKQMKKEKDRERSLKDLNLQDEEQDVSNVTANQENTSNESESNAGLEQFLALKSQGLGGAYSSPLNSQDQSQSQATEPSPAKSEEIEINRSTPQPKTRRNLNPPSPSTSSYLFYQASSGQPIYLNPLDIKILQSEYKSYSNFPENLKVKVSGSDEGSVNEELRKKHKYLSHLPMAADLVFVEVDWEAMIQGEEKIRDEIRSSSESTDDQPRFKPTISRNTLSQYENALRQRKNKRKDRSRREDKARSKAEGGDGFGGGANAREIREAKLKSSLDGDPELGRSFGSKSSVGGGNESEFGRSPRSENGFNHSTSPNFREQASWGAERQFEIHPGGNAGGEDFPDVLGSNHHQDSGNSPSLRPQNHPSSSTSTSTGTTRKTIWGTQSFANQSGGGTGGSRNDFEDPDFDEAWLELEEDHIVGNKSGNLKEGRGLNKQFKGLNNHHNNKPSSPGWGPSLNSNSSNGKEVERQEASTAVQANTNQSKKKKAKKLVLTSGGRGAG